MKKILGLDLGTNSIGWALIERDFENKTENVLGKGKIDGMGSRIIPMSQDVLDKFGQGQSHSQTAERTNYRGVRRLRQRHLLRRERLHRILNILKALPEHYADKIDFENRKGQFIDDIEVKLNYKEVEPKKFEFLFKNSFNEMLQEFKNAGYETKIPYDWTIYYLRKKALQKEISLQELAWILLNFNQKRGYYQLRGEEEEEVEGKSKTFEVLEVEKIVDSGEKIKSTGDILYDVYFKNEWKYDKPITKTENWINKTKEFIVTQTVTKSGDIKRTYKNVDSEQDWEAIKRKTEQDIEKSQKFISQYIYDILLKNPKQKINGKLVKTIERHFYKDELTAILKKQKEFHTKLNDKKVLETCINELYPNNYAQQNILKQNDITHIFVNDIIFYQRPLKSKKSLIDGCKYESRTFKNNDGKLETKAIKSIHKSHPLYQEFRLWQFVENIRILQREKNIDGKVFIDYDVTSEFLPSIDSKVELFDFFNDKEKIKQNTFLSYYKNKFGKKLSDKEYRWNYVEDKEYPLNETRALFISKLKKHKDFDWQTYLTQENEIKLWHLLYSISDKKEIERAFKVEDKYEKDIVFGLPFQIRKEFTKIKPFKNDYGALSEKAIKKLLPLMRIGIYETNNDDEYKNRIDNIYIRLNSIKHNKEKIKEVADDDITNGMLTSFCGFQKQYTGLKLHQASYAIYGKHAEAKDTNIWKTPKQLENFIKEFKQHSLRNPIVEQVITETLRVVKDIWVYYGEGKEDFFDEIHVELGRDMKNPADKRKRMTENINKNQNTNQRIRVLLHEFKNQNVEGIIPESPNQQEKLKIFEHDILSNYSEKELEKMEFNGINIGKVVKSTEPTNNEIEKYKLWLEQEYRSPYTGQIIPLSKLFTTDYEIEHILPQAKYFDNSLSNKIICEAEVNRFKDRQTAFEMISKHNGHSIELGQNKTVSLFSLKAYQDFVMQNFVKGSKKQRILLSEDIPENFISRQLTDTRYISKVIKGLLSNIVREDNEQEATSKNVVSVTGNVTNVLKNDWGLNNKWNEIIEPRFKRMNQITSSNDFGYFDKEKGFFRIDVPIELKKDFNKKRIDHRHHAMDALVVALATKNHVNYLSNQHAKSENKRYDLRNKLRHIEEKTYKGENRKYAKEFLLPWQNFPVDAKNSLENVIVSFKQNLRVINKASNKYLVWNKENGQLKRNIETQKGTNWAIRKPMHKETVYAKVNLRQKKTVAINAAIDGVFASKFIFVDKDINQKVKKLKSKHYDTKMLKKYFKDNKFNDNKIKKVEVYYQENNYSAVRKTVDENFKSIKWIEESITDTGIQKILINHLEKYNEIDEEGKQKERPDLAFSEEGLNEMNKNIKELNQGKKHQPIYKARVYETLGNKFAVGQTGNKKDKYVEAAKGTNLYFAIYKGKNKKDETVRQSDTIPLNIVIKRLKQGESPVPEFFFDKDNLEYNLLFYLSPNDLVYVPSEEEQDNINSIDFNNLSIAQKGRIYKMEKASGKECYFIPNRIALLIKQYDAKSKIGELGSQNKLQTTIDSIKVIENSIKLKVDRLGQIVKVRKY
ncbi:MAG: type II CRISPR RNA-guided endonuclease Cas9 [Bacteroidales bacterium]|nr:type II CRISPR RNA-guided endonuclease Cas9 [Bacteroidales bacterium]